MEKHDEHKDIHGEGTAALDARTCPAAVRTEFPYGRLRRCRDGCCATPAVRDHSALCCLAVCLQEDSERLPTPERTFWGRDSGSKLLVCSIFNVLGNDPPEDDHARRHGGPPAAPPGAGISARCRGRAATRASPFYPSAGNSFHICGRGEGRQITFPREESCEARDRALP